MDTSKEYIEMCLKAEEIQCSWEPSEGDFILNKSARPLPLAEHFVFVNYLQQPWCNCPEWELMVKIPSPYLIWLPRQDQFQEMLNKPTNELMITLFCDGQNSAIETDIIKNETKGSITIGEIINQYSMEQILLMVVMKKKFNKTWNGTDWIKGE